MKYDLNSRVDEYLISNNVTYPSSDHTNSATTTINGENSTIIKYLFPIPSFNESNDIVKYNALHHWCNACMEGTHRLEYVHLQRIQQQLEDYSDNRKWILNVGKGWNVCRNKGTLEMICDKSMSKKRKKK